jgi:DNA-binding MurR/RpiR family transcriptional regulator
MTPEEIMAETEGGTLAERMRSGFQTLTRAEKQLASAMLENYPMLGLESITVVAETAGVSTPTVLRMAKKFGYSGYPEMQAELRNELQATLSGPIAKHDRWAQAAPQEHILNRFANAATDNLRQTLTRLDPAEFDAVAALLATHRRQVQIVGGRITRSLAEYLFTHLQVVRPNVTLVASNSNAWPHYLLNLAEGDVLVAFDIRRYESDLERLAQMARERKARIVLFTDQWGSPVSKFADHTFHARIEAPSAWDSSVVIVFIVEALIAAIETRNWSRTHERMRDLEALFDRTKLFGKPR